VRLFPIHRRAAAHESEENLGYEASQGDLGAADNGGIGGCKPQAAPKL
jgi:hypothetical protein